jgi:hypothetical protein
MLERGTGSPPVFPAPYRAFVQHRKLGYLITGFQPPSSDSCHSASTQSQPFSHAAEKRSFMGSRPRSSNHTLDGTSANRWLAAVHPGRHPGLVPKSTGRLDEQQEGRGPRPRRRGPRHKAGVTKWGWLPQGPRPGASRPSHVPSALAGQQAVVCALAHTPDLSHLHKIRASLDPALLGSSFRPSG